MNIQLLDGIDIQLLDGTTSVTPLTTSQRELLRKLEERGRAEESNRLGVINTITKGYNNNINNEMEFVANGYDFINFGKGSNVNDDEMVRNHLVRTKKVLDSSPNMLAGFGNVSKLSTMLGYVIANWDTEHREDILDEMERQEQSAIDKGEFNYDVAEDMGDISAEDITDIDNWDIIEYNENLNGTAQLTQESSKQLTQRRKNNKTGIFTAVKKAVGNHRLTSEAKDVVNANPATLKLRKKQRSKIAKTRSKATINVGNKTAKISTVNTIDGLNGVDSEMNDVLNGTALEYAVKDINPLQAYYNYLLQSRNLVASRPFECFDTQEEANYYIEAINTILSSWHDERLRNHVLDKIANEPDESLDGLFKKIKKAIKKVGSAVKKAVKKVGTAVKKVVKAVGKGLKKLGKAIAKVTKKVWKFVVRFNPLTLLIRAGLLAACRLNMFKMANKCYIGSLTKAEALKKGATEEEWKKSNEAYGHLKKPFLKIGGKENKLKKALEKGNKKKWTGAEYPDNEGAIKTAAAKVATAQDDKETNADVTEAQNEMKSKGAVQDKSVSSDVESVSVKTEVEVVENEKTAKTATKLYEEGATSAKVLISIPKGAKVLIDEKQGDTTFYAATYNNKTGYVKKTDLAGIYDSESVAVIGLNGLYDMGYFEGLGEPATAASAAAASGVIASILAKIKKIFGVVKNVATKVVNKVKNVVNKAKTAKDKVDEVKNNVTNTVSSIKQTTAQAKNIVTSAKNTATNVVASAKKIAAQIPKKSTVVNNIVSSTMYVTAKSGLVMRSGASTTAPQILAIPYGSKVTIVNGGGNTTGWKSVSYGGRTGWCSASYLSNTMPTTTPTTNSTTTMYVNAQSGLVLRATASTTATKLLTIPYGASVKLVGNGGNTSGWLNVVYNNKTGWCSASYLSKNKPTTTTTKIAAPTTAVKTVASAKPITPTTTTTTTTKQTSPIVVADGKTYVNNNPNKNNGTLLTPTNTTEIKSVATQASIGGGNSAKKWFLLGGGLLIAGIATMFSLRKKKE